MSRKKAWRLAGLNRLLKRDGHLLSLLSLVRGEMFCCKFRRNLHCGLWSAGGEWGVSLKSSSCHEAAWAWARNWELRGSHRVQRGEGAGLMYAASPSQVPSLFSQPGAVFSLCRKSGLVTSFSYLLSRFYFPYRFYSGVASCCTQAAWGGFLRDIGKSWCLLLFQLDPFQ